MIILTRLLASQMLDVWERRQRDPQGSSYDSSVLQAAQYGFPDTFSVHRGANLTPKFIRVRGRWRKVAP